MSMIGYMRTGFKQSIVWHFKAILRQPLQKQGKTHTTAYEVDAGPSAADGGVGGMRKDDDGRLRAGIDHH
jgi:hypothetical protein